MSLISIVIPAYNSEKTIYYTIRSVLEQTFKNFELIVINDGSEDSTPEIVSQFQDPRIKLLTYSHAGGNVSRNRGIAHTTGELISFLDADDLWTPDKLESQCKALQDNPTAKVAYSWTDYIDEEGKFLSPGMRVTLNGNVYQHLLEANFLENGSNPLIYKEALIALGGFDETLAAAQDWDMWLRLAHQYDFIAVPAAQILYRISPHSLSSNLTRQEKASLIVLDKACKQNSHSMQNIRKKSLANLYRYLTCKALQQPLNRQKGLTAAIFLWKYIIHESVKHRHMTLILKLWLKIAVLLLLPSALTTSLLVKKSHPQLQKSGSL